MILLIVSSLLTSLFIFLIKSPLLHYVKGNNSRFGCAIQVLPSDITEYFNLSFIIVVVVFIIFDLFFLFYIQKSLYVMYTTFVIQKMSFFNHCRILFVRNKVVFTYLLYLLIHYSVTQ